MQSTYLEQILLTDNMKSELKTFANDFPFKHRRNKNLYPRLCVFMFRLINDGLRQGQVLSPTYFYSENIRRILGRNYLSIINGLIECKILTTDGLFIRPKQIEVGILKNKLNRTKNPVKRKALKSQIEELEQDEDYESKAKSYSIRKDLLSGDLKKFSVQVSKTLEQPNKVPKCEYERKTYKALMAITLHYNNVNKEIVQRIENREHLETYKINYNTKGSFFKSVQVWNEEDGCIETLTNTTLDYLKENYKYGDVQLIRNEKTYYYMSKERFEEIKTINTYYSHMFWLIRWENKKHFVKREYKTILLRDGTSLTRAIRLHHTMTTTPSFFRKHMKMYGNKLFNLDICNSQFMFLTFCLRNREEDNRITAFANINGYLFDDEASLLFFSLCEKGKLYEYVAAQIKARRAKGKTFCFRVLFDMARENEENKMIQHLFPKIHAFLNHYKAYHGYEALSSELQCIEASIIVDDILFTHLNHLKGATIHDSFIFCSKNYESMRVIAIDRLNIKIGKDRFTTKRE